MYKIFDNSVPRVEVVHNLTLTHGHGGISLVLVNDQGDILIGGYICAITREGELLITRGVTERAGLQIENGHIKITGI